jgi:hypothetical protein
MTVSVTLQRIRMEINCRLNVGSGCKLWKDQDCDDADLVSVR